MKKALLALSLICALPIAPLHAGLFSWRATPITHAIPAFPESCSEGYKAKAQPVIDSIAKIKTEEKRQAFAHSALKGGLITLAAVGGAALSYEVLKKQFNEHVTTGLLISPFSTFPKAVMGVGILENQRATLTALAGLVISEITTPIGCAYTGYNLLRSLCIQKQNAGELIKEYNNNLGQLNSNNDLNAVDQAHMGQLIISTELQP